jgi:hypothetical protein
MGCGYETEDEALICPRCGRPLFPQSHLNLLERIERQPGPSLSKVTYPEGGDVGNPRVIWRKDVGGLRVFIYTWDEETIHVESRIILGSDKVYSQKEAQASASQDIRQATIKETIKSLKQGIDELYKKLLESEES